MNRPSMVRPHCFFNKPALNSNSRVLRQRTLQQNPGVFAVLFPPVLVELFEKVLVLVLGGGGCLLYTSDAADD